ncbi:SDR family oxidoreductase [bacterium]|nr:SDR family oxidoreductase [bacterium]
MKGVVLISGAATGFGFLLVERLLEAGWHVVATCRQLAARKETFAGLNQRFPGALELYEMDVTASADRVTVLQAVQKKHGGLDALVNNAGYGLFGALEDISEEQLRYQFEVNFFGLSLLTREALPLLRAKKGRIIMLSSLLGRVGMPLTGAYCASKFAVEGLSESLRYELKEKGVQVAVVGPGGHRTQFAKNVQWAVGVDDPKSPYYQRSQGYRAMMQRILTGKPNPPDAVAATIVRLLSLKKMPFRVACGKDAVFLGALRKVLPLSSFLGMTQRVLDKQMVARP